MQSLKSRQKGITLIALVVTIIILLILAGVSINLVSGGNGILRRATGAAKTYNESAILEKAELVVAELQMDYYAEGMPTPTFGDYLKEHDTYISSTGEIFIFEVNDDDNTADIYYYKDKDSEEADMEMVLDLNTNEITIQAVGGEVTADTKKPSITVTNVTTSTLTFKITDRGGVLGYKVTTTEVQPGDSDWEPLDGGRAYEGITVSGLKLSTTHYIWAIDKTGNVIHISQATKPFEPIEIDYEVKADGTAEVTLAPKIPTTDAKYYIGTAPSENLDDYQPYTGPVSVGPGENIYFIRDDGTNNTLDDVYCPEISREATLTYLRNDGTASPNDELSSQKVPYGGTATIDSSIKPTREGYVFIGWATTKTATAPDYKEGGVTTIDVGTRDIKLYAVWSNKATDAITPGNFGDKVDYTAGGVDAWDIFWNDGKNVYIIADDYVPASKLTLGTGIETDDVTDKDFYVRGDSRDNLINWLQDTSKWTKFATGGITGATATGGPTISEFVNSYKAANNVDYSEKVENSEGWYLEHDPLDSVWVKTSTENAYATWIASPVAGSEDFIWFVNCEGNVYMCMSDDNEIGVRPLVKLPEGAKATKLEDGKWKFSN